MDFLENCFQNKAIKIFILFCSLSFNYCFSQNGETIFKLKDNKTIKGYVLNKDFGILRIRTNSNSKDSIVFVQMYDIDSIDGKTIEKQAKTKYQENRQYNRSSPMTEVYKSQNINDEINKNLQLHPVREKELPRRTRPRQTYWHRKIYGYRGFTDISYTHGIGYEKIDRVEFSTSHGFQFNPTYYLGIGVVYSIPTNSRDLLPFPFFINGRINFQDSHTTPYLDMRTGFSMLEKKGFYYSCIFGVSLSKNEQLSFNMGIGYSIQNAVYTNEHISNDKVKEKYKGITFRFTIEF